MLSTVGGIPLLGWLLVTASMGPATEVLACVESLMFVLTAKILEELTPNTCPKPALPKPEDTVVEPPPSLPWPVAPNLNPPVAKVETVLPVDDSEFLFADAVWPNTKPVVAGMILDDVKDDELVLPNLKPPDPEVVVVVADTNVKPPAGEMLIPDELLLLTDVLETIPAV